MTTIAWDGKTLAADKQATLGGSTYTTRKLYRIGDYLIGVSGYKDKAAAVLEWFAAGRDPATYPDNKERDVFLLAIHISGRVERYEVSGHPCEVEDTFHAMGSGRDYATAAMFLGCDAVRAVEVSAQFDENTGRGVDTLTFDTSPDP